MKKLAHKILRTIVDNDESMPCLEKNNHRLQHYLLLLIVDIWQKATVFRFVIVGVANTLFGYALFTTLYVSGTPYAAAVVLSTIIGVIFNFFSSGKFVFNVIDLRRIILFSVFYVIVMGLNIEFIKLCTEINIAVLYGSAMFLPIGATLSFVFQKNIVFRKT